MSKLTDFYVHKAAIIEKGEPIIQSGGGWKSRASLTPEGKRR